MAQCPYKLGEKFKTKKVKRRNVEKQVRKG
jgi:hypothetical protein